MIALIVSCRICGTEHIPNRTEIVQRDYHVCPPCRSAVRNHAERAMQQLGYAPPAPDHPEYAVMLERWDSRWQAQLATAERVLTRIHDLEREPPGDAA